MRYDHFIRNVDKNGKGGCWIWIGRLNRRGYGEHRAWNKAARGKYFAAHRLSWEFHVGKIPEGVGYHGTVVAHRCDTPACVNPDHLFLTDQRGNLRDCLAKGRSNKAFGERAGKAKLREFEVQSIRNEAANGVDRAALAEEFNVTSQTVVDIVVRKSWQHMPSEVGTVEKAPRSYNTEPNSGSFQKGRKGISGPRPELRTNDYEKIKAMFGSGKTARQIAIACGTSHPTVVRVAKQCGIDIGSPFKRMTDADKEHIRNLRTQGHSHSEIAGMAGVSQASVSRTLTAGG
jgi:uncharacterized protein YerC